MLSSIMPLVELFTVEDAILLGGNKGPGMLMLQPTFPKPQGWRHSVHTPEPVLIIRPNGQQTHATAHIGLSYPQQYSGRNPVVSVDRELRITIWFSDLSEYDVPVGSKIMISQELRDAIVSNRAA